MGLQFCRAVHREQTLRFPSKRQHNRFSEARHCFPASVPRFQAGRGLSIASVGVLLVKGGYGGQSLPKRCDLLTSPVPGQQQGDRA